MSRQLFAMCGATSYSIALSLAALTLAGCGRSDAGSAGNPPTNSTAGTVADVGWPGYNRTLDGQRFADLAGITSRRTWRPLSVRFPLRSRASRLTLHGR